MNLINKGSMGKLGKSQKSADTGNARTNRENAKTRMASSNPLQGLQTVGFLEGINGQSEDVNELPEGVNQPSVDNGEEPTGESTISEEENGTSRGVSRTSAETNGASEGESRTSAGTNGVSRGVNRMPAGGTQAQVGRTGGSSAIPGALLGRSVTPSKTNKNKVHPLRGVRTLAKRYTGPILSKAGGIVLGGAGTLIGFSAGVAQGDIGKALGGAVAGANAGYNGGQRLVNSGLNVANSAAHIEDKRNNVKDTYNEGARGKEYVQNQQFDREFFKGEGYRQLKDKYPDIPKEHIQDMLDAGITDTKRMSKILEKNRENPRKYELRKAIAYSTLAKNCPNDILYSDNKFIRYCKDKDIEITPEEVKAIRKVLIEFK